MTIDIKDSGRNTWKMLALAVAGVGILLLSQAAYMQVFSYPVMTRNTENGVLHVEITYIDPLASLFPFLLATGLVVSMCAFWKSRSLLSLYKREIWMGLLAGAILTLFSLIYAQHQPTQGPNDYYDYGFPLPWLVNIIVDLVHRSIWAPTPWVIDDLLFWAASTYCAAIVFRRLEKLRNKPAGRSSSGLGVPPNVPIRGYHADSLK